jgi:hypothetical protein
MLNTVLSISDFVFTGESLGGGNHEVLVYYQIDTAKRFAFKKLSQDKCAVEALKYDLLRAMEVDVPQHEIICSDDEPKNYYIATEVDDDYTLMSVHPIDEIMFRYQHEINGKLVVDLFEALPALIFVEHDAPFGGLSAPKNQIGKCQFKFNNVLLKLEEDRFRARVIDPGDNLSILNGGYASMGYNDKIRFSLTDSKRLEVGNRRPGGFGSALFQGLYDLFSHVGTDQLQAGICKVVANMTEATIKHCVANNPLLGEGQKNKIIAGLSRRQELFAHYLCDMADDSICGSSDESSWEDLICSHDYATSSYGHTI